MKHNYMTMIRTFMKMFPRFLVKKKEEREIESFLKIIFVML